MAKYAVAMLAVLVSLPLSVAATATTTELIMFERTACEWCQRWHEEIGPIYPKTTEGCIAPLRRVNIAHRHPDDIAFIKNIRYTPTFVLTDGTKEIDRINGYPGPDFFWGLLARMMTDLETHHNGRCLS